MLEFDQFTGSDAAGSSVHSLGRIEEPVSYSQRILRMVSFVLLLALAGLSFFWWQEQADRRAADLASTSLEHVEVDGADGTTQIHPLDEPEDQAVEAAQLDAGVTLPPLTEGAAELPSATGTEAAAVVAPQIEPPQNLNDTAGTPAVPASSAEAPPEGADAVPAVSSAPAPAPAPAPVQAAAGEAVVSLTFIADCWTQLTDANGKVLFSALKRKGDSLEVVGKAPLELRLGFARGAQVSLNGSPVDVAPFISGETARLKLGGQ